MFDGPTGGEPEENLASSMIGLIDHSYVLYFKLKVVCVFVLCFRLIVLLIK